MVSLCWMRERNARGPMLQGKKDPRPVEGRGSSGGVVTAQSQLSVPPAWYSVTRVSKKFFSLRRSMISLIQGKGFFTPAFVAEVDSLEHTGQHIRFDPASGAWYSTSEVPVDREHPAQDT